ncbi:MAG: glutathione S-transferase family protein [Proteobacteria bacterium]|nr:glutathione S-transferase family protein [Pseudomonadota bacterium]
MTFRYVTVEEAMAAPGLRMVVVGAVPSPWGEAAKGIFHLKQLDWLAVRLDQKDEALARWSGQRNAPVAMYAQEKPRDGWAGILLLAERLAPEPRLLPASAPQRALMLGLAQELMGEEGLAWTRRLQLIHAGLHGNGGFPERVAQYLAGKYGYLPAAASEYPGRVAALLQMLAARLRSQQSSGSGWLVGDALTAADIYCATVMALFRPLPQDVCDMHPGVRAAFETVDQQTAAALDPVLLEHRDRIYAQHLTLPLSL